MTIEATGTDTTMGACTICARRSPEGMRLLLGGAAIFGGGVIAGIAAWSLNADPMVSALPFAVGTVLGLPLIAFGVRNALGPARPFVDGALALANGGVVRAGDALDARVELRPEHALMVQSATLELLAVETDAHGAERVLRVDGVPFAPGLRLEAPVEKTERLHVAPDWPLTMNSPDQPGVERLRVHTRLRLTIDFAAHPLFTRELAIVVSR